MRGRRGRGHAWARSAEMVANTPYRDAAPVEEGCATSAEIVAGWRSAGRLVVRRVELAAIRPDWLGECVDQVGPKKGAAR